MTVFKAFARNEGPFSNLRKTVLFVSGDLKNVPFDKRHLLSCSIRVLIQVG